MRQRKNYTRREWLNPRPEYGTAFIDASVVHEASYPAAGVKIADCGRIIELDFGMYDSKGRRNSLGKLTRLIDVLTDFRAELEILGRAQEKKAQSDS